jgi:predicted nuclease of restriction endonuclease-like (RecB) superfamily
MKRNISKKKISKKIVQHVVAQSYDEFLEKIKERIRNAQVKAALAANAELILHYWEVGSDILINQKKQGWGAKVIDHLAADVARDFPTLGGYSVRNLKYMRSFAEAWPHRLIVQQLVAQIPWGHNCVLLDKADSATTRIFYIKKTIENGWKRSVLQLQIETALHKRIGKAVTNFKLTLPQAQSELAQELLKDPYVLKPAPLDEEADERALEQALLSRLKDFLIELGNGFAFMGNQVRLEVDGNEYFLDLLFYHTRLHAYVVIELKVVDFLPEFAGKMSFYQTAVDHIYKTEQDAPTIGLILCKGKSKTIVEYTLRDIHSPMGVAEYKILPREFKRVLPEVGKIKEILDSKQ